MKEQNNLVHPGAIIRCIRKEKKLTQAELCGEEIARNLLSQIESGKVNPSLRTLRYLADRLEVPLSRLFLTNEEQSTLALYAAIPQIRSAWEDKNFTLCLALCEKIEGAEELICFYRVGSKYHLAYNAYLSGDFGMARKYLKAVVSDPYGEADMKEAAQTLLSRMEWIQTADAPNSLSWGNPLSHDPEQDLLTFICRCVENQTLEGIPEAILPLKFQDQNTKYLILSLLYEAKGMDVACREAQKNVREKELDPAAALYYYRAVEECCARMNDYEAAYKMAKKRNQLLKQLQQKQDEKG